MAARSIGEIIGATAPAPGLDVVVATGLFAFLVSGSTFFYLATGERRALLTLNVVGTIVHEAGHAFVSVFTGGGVRRLTVTSGESGSTLTNHPSWSSNVVTLAAGYAMPPLAGLGAAWLVDRGHAAAVLTITVLVMAGLLVHSRDPRTIGFVLSVGVLAFGALYWGPPQLQSVIACAESWLLLTSEIGGLAHVVAIRARGRQSTDDATRLASKTFIPAIVWIAGWALLIGWSLWNGVPLLLP